MYCAGGHREVDEEFNSTSECAIADSPKAPQMGKS